MTLTDTAYLEIDDGDGTTATFEFHNGLEEGASGTKNFIMGSRGQYVTEIADNEVVDFGIDAVQERRAGWVIDGGAGTSERTLSFETGLEDVRWGDGSDGTGPNNVTTTDASGADVHPLDRRDVLLNWVRTTRTDSLGLQARLHWGQWTDGNITGITGVSAGAAGQPIPVAIREWDLPSPDPDESVASFSGSLTLDRIQEFPIDALPDWVAEPATKIAAQIEGVND